MGTHGRSPPEELLPHPAAIPNKEGGIPQLCLEEEETSGQPAKEKVWMCHQVSEIPKGGKRFPNLSCWWSFTSQLIFSKLEGRSGAGGDQRVPL